MNYSLDDHQWKQDWMNTVSLAGTAGASLEQTHVFALAHILRRPIIVYAVKYVKSRKGETIDYARFEGSYINQHYLFSNNFSIYDMLSRLFLFDNFLIAQLDDQKFKFKFLIKNSYLRL